MKNNIKVNNYGKFTCLDFPKRNARLVYDTKTKEYNIFSIPQKIKKVEKESPIWKNTTLIMCGMCAGMLLIIGILAIKVL